MIKAHKTKPTILLVNCRMDWIQQFTMLGNDRYKWLYSSEQSCQFSAEMCDSKCTKDVMTVQKCSSVFHVHASVKDESAVYIIIAPQIA